VFLFNVFVLNSGSASFQMWTKTNQSKKFQQFAKPCKSYMSQNSKRAKTVLGQYYRVLNFRLAITRLAILSTWKILL